ncbi:MAG: hypothetical protein R2843_00235 [Thermomicrobiales bacterium]
MICLPRRSGQPRQPSDGPFWDDPYISTQLLKAHLSEQTAAASRPGIEPDRMVRNLTDRGLAGPGVRVLISAAVRDSWRSDSRRAGRS